MVSFGMGGLVTNSTSGKTSYLVKMDAAGNGSWIKAIVLCCWGLLVVSVIDNVLYPILVAGELRLHTLAVFFAVLGGLIAFGVCGVVLGPAILAVTFGLLELWKIRGGTGLETDEPPIAVAVAREDP